MNPIVHQSSDWLDDLRDETSQKLEPKRRQLKAQFKQEKALAYQTRLATAKGWRRLLLLIQMKLEVRHAVKKAIELELKKQNLPVSSPKSLW